MAKALEVKDLTVVYRHGLGKEKAAINGVSLELEAGSILGLLGPNGAGKTTLIKSMMGLINIKSGSISVLGSPVSPSAKRSVGYMPEIANFYWFLTPKETLCMLGRLSGMKKDAIIPRAEKVLDMVGLSAERAQLIKSFSKGMSERLNMAQAILHDPKLLILDEPFSGLDPLGRIQMRNVLSGLKKEGKTILLSSHELSEAELVSDEICIMKSGRILKSAPLAKILEESSDKSLERYFLKMIGG